MISSARISHRHWKLKEQALKLRADGLSYNEITQRVPVAKSTISLWCRYVLLTKEQSKKLNERYDEKLLGIKAIQKMFWQKRMEAFNSGLGLISKPGKYSRFIAGLALYWAEGTKQKTTAITNSDPQIIIYMARWLEEFYGIGPKILTIELHLHSGQNEQNMKQYWSKLTGVPIANFQKSFVKPEGSGYRKNVHYMGTVKLRVRGQGSTYLLFKILGSIAGLIQKTLNEKAKPEKWMTKLPYA